MTYDKIKRISDLKIVLKDMEPYIKDPRVLRVGRPIPNFSLRPREAFANWLLCVVGNYYYGNDQLTFAEDPTGGDGIILNKISNELILTEHVYIPEQKPENVDGGEDLMMSAVQHKVSGKNTAYAKGKHLIIFSEANVIWTPNRVARRIHGTHDFESVWAMGLMWGNEIEYKYSITRLTKPNPDSMVWTVSIDFNFTSWSVERIQ